MSFISLLGAIASNINASNISEFVQLTENLVGIGESLVSEIESVVKPAVAAQPASKVIASVLAPSAFPGTAANS
jgi:hypothetical protein